MKKGIKSVPITICLCLLSVLTGFIRAGIIEELLVDPSQFGYAQYSSHCAYDGKNFLVVWADTRSD